jgi:hypothetical protein
VSGTSTQLSDIAEGLSGVALLGDFGANALGENAIMQTVGWLAILAVTVAAAFSLGYWFGYRCGQHDAEDGVGEP